MEVSEAMSEPGRRRLEVWVYDVVNPLLSFSGLEHPLDLLARESWSWRFYRQRLEWIRPVQELLELEAHPNLEDLVDSNPTEGQAVLLWDEGITRLEAAAGAEFSHIRTSQSFCEAARACMARFEPTRSGSPWGAWPEEKAPDLLAEHLVNNRRDLEGDNSGREFWEQSRDDLLASVSADATWVGLDAKTHAAGEDLLVAGRELQKALKAFRKRVCTEHDIPFAPPSYR